MKLSTFIAGFWRLKQWGKSPQELLRFIEQNIELGVTTMDHAMVYRSEAPFGQALALSPSLRDKMQIVTKCGIRPVGFGDLGAKSVNHYDSSRKAIIESLEASLRDLKTDVIDVLLIHRPDYLMDYHEVSEAFSELKNAGKVKAFGVSNFTQAQFDALQSISAEPLVTNQIEFSPYYMEALDSGIFDQCVKHGISPMLWSCLAGGQLLNPQDDKGQRLLKALQLVAEQVNADCVEQVVYAWVLALPSKPYPLVGTQNIERVKLAVKAADITLSKEQWYRIWEASNGASVP